jgi:hypothetical protein
VRDRTQGGRPHWVVLKFVSTRPYKNEMILTPTHARLVDETVRRDVVHLAITTKTGEAVCEIDPGTDQDGASRQCYSLVSQSD